MTDIAPGEPDPMVPRRARVLDAWRELEGVVSMSLAPVDGDLPAFQAGQFNMLYAFGVGEAAISISGDPGTPGELIHTIRDVGKVSGALARLAKGDMLGIRGPYGTGWPMAAAKGRHLLIMAGGLGLAPLRPALLQALRHASDFDGISVLLGARSPRDLLFAYQLADWAANRTIDLRVTVDHAAPGWTGAVGVVTTQIDRVLAGRDPAQVTAFVCGPEIMMRFGCMALEDAGIAARQTWVSMERNMKCALGFCGHCQYGEDFVCRDGPVFRYDRVVRRFGLKEI